VPPLNNPLAERIEVFSRSASEALQKALGDVLEARSPWQLLYRLSRIVLLGLVLYTAWLLITLQPDLARRLLQPPPPTLQQQLAAHQDQVQSLLLSSTQGGRDGLHSLLLVQWDGGSTAAVLLSAGWDSPGTSSSDQPLLLGVEMATALGHLALGSARSEQPQALPLPIDAAGSSLGSAARVALLCPVDWSSGSRKSSSSQRALLLALYDQQPTRSARASGHLAANGLNQLRQQQHQQHQHQQQEQQQQQRRQQELLLIAHRLAELLGKTGPNPCRGDLFAPLEGITLLLGVATWRWRYQGSSRVNSTQATQPVPCLLKRWA
jgi:hypothetical protein